jgi:serine/threonine-protein kinase RsbW
VASVELRFSPSPGHVRTARLLAAAVGRRSGVSPLLLDEVKLAVDEACSRAVSVHQRTAPDELVTVLLSDDDGMFTVQVLDRGSVGEEIPPTHDGGTASATEMLDPDEVGAPERDPTSTLPPGLGLALITGLVDNVDISRGKDERGTVVAMRWPVVPAARPAPGET